MARIAFDTNILGYAELEPESDKGRRAADLIIRAAGNAVIPAQVLGELLRLVQRKLPQALPQAAKQVDIYRAAFPIAATTDSVVAVAADLALERRMHVWDCVICVAAAQAGATVLFTEDMQDGADIRGLRIVNPFDAKNDALVDGMLA